MTAKHPGGYAKDSSKYATIVDGSGSLFVTTTVATGSTKKTGSQAPDGSIYMTLTNGSGTHV